MIYLEMTANGTSRLSAETANLLHVASQDPPVLADPPTLRKYGRLIPAEDQQGLDKYYKCGSSKWWKHTGKITTWFMHGNVFYYPQKPHNGPPVSLYLYI